MNLEELAAEVTRLKDIEAIKNLQRTSSSTLSL
jgi:hypothetical protein